MKNQYFGDVGDYGKYGLLRYFATNKVRIGINWYLTPDDSSSDGKFISYLYNPTERIYDPILFESLRQIIEAQGRNVNNIESAGLIPNAVYFSDVLNTNKLSWELREAERKKWHIKAMSTLNGTDLIFMDPDNGLLGKKKISQKNSEKFASQSEIVDFYNSGKNIVYYCHKGRRTAEKWEEAKREMLKYLPNAKIMVLTYHRGTQRSFVFVIHEDNYATYKRIITQFLESDWGKLFTSDGEYYE